MLHGVYAVVDGEVVQGVSAQDGMPGCKIGCRIGPNPKTRCKMEFWTICKQRGARWSAEICFILYIPFPTYTLGTLVHSQACSIP